MIRRSVTRASIEEPIIGGGDLRRNKFAHRARWLLGYFLRKALPFNLSGSREYIQPRAIAAVLGVDFLAILLLEASNPSDGFFGGGF